MIPEYRKCLYPWIITVPEEDDTATLRSFLKIRNGLDALIAMKITWHDYLDILDSEWVDMDEYLDLADQYLITAGF